MSINKQHFLCFCFLLLTALVKANPILDAQVFFQKGNVFLRAQQYEEAITAYTQAIASHPHFAHAYHKRGTAYYFSQLPSLACHDWYQACQMDHYCMGWNFGVYSKICKAVDELSTKP